MYPGHRGMGGVPPANGAGGRLNELLDQIRGEFESHLRQTENYEHQSKDAYAPPLGHPNHRRRVHGLRLGAACPNSMTMLTVCNSSGSSTGDAIDP